MNSYLGLTCNKSEQDDDHDQSTSMTQSIGESFSCALVLCYLALMIKEEFQIRYYEGVRLVHQKKNGVRPAMLFILHYGRNIIFGSNTKKIYI